jgi:serine/threonine protein kinase
MQAATAAAAATGGVQQLRPAAVIPLPELPPWAKTPNFHAAYRLGRQLGQGANGIVLEAEHQATKQRVAVKVLKKPVRGCKVAAAQILDEVAVWSSVQRGSPHVARLYEVYEVSSLLVWT